MSTTALPLSHLTSRWPLVCTVAAAISALMVIGMALRDMRSPLMVSEMLQYSVRLSVPWLYLAFAASALRSLYPNGLTRALLRNRRYLGLCFAAGMAWQLFFILWLVLGHPQYYAAEVYLLSDIIVQLPGYAFLIAMTLTSFAWGRRAISPGQWRTLHTVGIYFLWATVWSTYWYELYYYDDIQPIDYIYYWTGILAWVVRPIAWARQHRQGSGGIARGLVVMAGLAAVVAGSVWAPASLQFFYDKPFPIFAELLLPFLPVLFIAAGIYLSGRPTQTATA